MACRLESIALSACRRIPSSSSSSSIFAMTCMSSHRASSRNTIALSRLCASQTIRPTPTTIATLPRHYFHSTPSRLDDAKPSPPPAAAADNNNNNASSTPPLPPKLEELFQKIIYLDMVEIHLLTELINEKLGVKISDAEKERMARGGRRSSDDDDGDDSSKEEVKQEQTAFDLKLTGFDEKAKIKVIKEVRAITALGLKEAKELVEGCRRR
eukprot:CCRYP_009339-RA/>CCRYP_009339-RA protein AED:0.47 eAED:0.47 QI:0/-1/0/1/-1/1/1/0/211